jgi:hypothetical protein
MEQLEASRGHGGSVGIAFAMSMDIARASPRGSRGAARYGVACAVKAGTLIVAGGAGDVGV